MPVFFVPLLMFPLLWSSLLPHLSLIFCFLIPIIPCSSNLIKYYWSIWHLDKLRNFYHRYQKSIFKLLALLSHKPFDFLDIARALLNEATSAVCQMRIKKEKYGSMIHKVTNELNIYYQKQVELFFRVVGGVYLTMGHDCWTLGPSFS